jgi:hypothetical protein
MLAPRIPLIPHDLAPLDEILRVRERASMKLYRHDSSPDEMEPRKILERHLSRRARYLSRASRGLAQSIIRSDTILCPPF